MLDDDVRPGDLLQGSLTGRFYLVIDTEQRRDYNLYTKIKVLFVSEEGDTRFIWDCYDKDSFTIIQRTP